MTLNLTPGVRPFRCPSCHSRDPTAGGPHLASGDANGEVVVWDVGCGGVTARLSDSFSLAAHQRERGHGDGTVLVSVGEWGVR
eukprot:365956-Chlamydomonas_euryale.AAC.4